MADLKIEKLIYSKIQVVNAMGHDLPMQHIIIGSTISMFTLLLLIQGFGGFGTLEGGWTIGYMAVGVPKQIAIASGFGMHIISFIYTLIIGVFGILILKMSIRSNRGVIEVAG